MLAIQGLNFAAGDPDALVMPELIGTDTLPSEPVGYFTTPTPGAANGTALSGLVADTQFSVDRGFFDAPFQLEITTTTPGAQIYYTTNGEAPTQATGTLYTGPINIDKTTTLRAAAFLAGYLPTNVDTQTYLFLNDVVQQTYAQTLSQGFPTTWGTSVPNSNSPAAPTTGSIRISSATSTPTATRSAATCTAAFTPTQLKDALLAIPTMSIVMDLDDLFSASAGIVHQCVAARRGVGAADVAGVDHARR